MEEILDLSTDPLIDRWSPLLDKRPSKTLSNFAKIKPELLCEASIKKFNDLKNSLTKLWFTRETQPQEFLLCYQKKILALCEIWFAIDGVIYSFTKNMDAYTTYPISALYNWIKETKLSTEFVEKIKNLVLENDSILQYYK